jgi:hypothetical protein
MNRPCRCVFAGMSLLCLLSAGCMQVPFCFPEINYVPSLAAQCKSSEVHAFRVDVTQTTEVKDGRGEVVEREELSRLRTSVDGTVSSQLALSFSSGWRYVGVVNFTSSTTEHGLALRLYRPGYETILLTAGQTMQELQWRQAPDLKSQIKAIDDLMHGSKLNPTSAVSVRQALEPGAKSAAHKAALQFGASEYERLARDAESSQSRRDLLDEAGRLRRLADAKRE